MSGTVPPPLALPLPPAMTELRTELETELETSVAQLRMLDRNDARAEEAPLPAPPSPAPLAALAVPPISSRRRAAASLDECLADPLALVDRYSSDDNLSPPAIRVRVGVGLRARVRARMRVRVGEGRRSAKGEGEGER